MTSALPPLPLDALAPFRRAEPVMGTVASLHVHHGPDEADTVTRAADAVFDALRHDESVFSVFRPDSQVSRVRSGCIGEECADAIIEQWYVDEQAFNDAQSTEPAQAAWNDVGNYAKTEGTAFWLMRETVLIEPPATGPGTLEV